MQLKEYVLNTERDVKLTAFIQDVGGEFGKIDKRPAVIVLPGGGYQVCSDREADPVALAFAKAGFQAFVLRYTVKSKGQWDYPLKDYDEAVEFILTNKAELNVDTDKIAVCGFSAGGHLAAYAATRAQHRPKAAILGYAALDSDVCDSMLPGLPYPSQTVDEKTCPCFLVACRDDNVVDMGNTIHFIDALNKFGIAFETHIYSYGGHGFSTAEESVVNAAITPRAKNWIRDCTEWLGEVWGSLTYDGYTEPKFDRTSNENSEDTLSLKCTLGYLNEFSEQTRSLIKFADDGVKAILAGGDLDPEKSYIAVCKKFRVIDILKLMRIPEDKVKELNDVLQKIQNKK